MEVTSKKSVHFPKFNWGINAGEKRTLPENEEAQKAILAHKSISKVEGGTSTPPKPKEETPKAEESTKAAGGKNINKS